MNVIIPLAGPDFYSESYGVKPLHPINGQPLIKHVLDQRPWGDATQNKFIFAMQDNPIAKEASIKIKTLYPKSHFCFLSDYTKGALLSAAAACTLIKNFEEPIIVDLIDIGFKIDLNISNILAADKRIEGILPIFDSSRPEFSYAEIKSGWVIRTAEKQVISRHASAGVYIFRDLECLFKAAAHSVANYEELCSNQNLFLCPSLNGLIAGGGKVLPIEISGTELFSLQFKSVQDRKANKEINF